MGVTGHTAAAAAKRKVHNGAFPGHPHAQGTDGIKSLQGVKANAALGGSTAVVELHVKPAQNLGFSVIQPYGQAELHFAHGNAQELPDGMIQLKQISTTVELLLSHLKKIKWFFVHFLFPFILGRGRHQFVTDA